MREEKEESLHSDNENVQFKRKRATNRKTRRVVFWTAKKSKTSRDTEKQPKEITKRTTRKQRSKENKEADDENEQTSESNNTIKKRSSRSGKVTVNKDEKEGESTETKRKRRTVKRKSAIASSEMMETSDSMKKTNENAETANNPSNDNKTKPKRKYTRRATKRATKSTSNNSMNDDNEGESLVNTEENNKQLPSLKSLRNYNTKVINGINQLNEINTMDKLSEKEQSEIQELEDKEFMKKNDYRDVFTELGRAYIVYDRIGDEVVKRIISTSSCENEEEEEEERIDVDNDYNEEIKTFVNTLVYECSNVQSNQLINVKVIDVDDGKLVLCIMADEMMIKPTYFCKNNYEYNKLLCSQVDIKKEDEIETWFSTYFTDICYSKTMNNKNLIIISDENTKTYLKEVIREVPLITTITVTESIKQQYEPVCLLYKFINCYANITKKSVNNDKISALMIINKLMTDNELMRSMIMKSFNTCGIHTDKYNIIGIITKNDDNDVISDPTLSEDENYFIQFVQNNSTSSAKELSLYVANKFPFVPKEVIHKIYFE